MCDAITAAVASTAMPELPCQSFGGCSAEKRLGQAEPRSGFDLNELSGPAGCLRTPKEGANQGLDQVDWFRVHDLILVRDVEDVYRLVGDDAAELSQANPA